MKWINIAFSDEEFEAILERKGDRTWRQFLLDQDGDDAL